MLPLSAGVSRSVTITVAYLMKRKHMTFRQAFAHVKKCRPIANPNIGFIRQLEQYGASLASERKAALKAERTQV